MPIERQYALWLSSVPGIGSLRIRKLFDHFGSFRDIWYASEKELRSLYGIGEQLALTIAKSRDQYSFDQAEALLASHSVRVLLLNDPDYPASLAQIHDPPYALYVKGEYRPQDHVSIAVVGSRSTTPYGEKACALLTEPLAQMGVAIISGLARGIDAVAHRAALRVGGRTIAVLAGGTSKIYPPYHRDLASQIVPNGALISEYPPLMPALPTQFPARNRIISGLSLGVIVIEAGEKSGSLITADQALEQGRNVYAVPGPITSPASAGTHHLIRQGATLVTSIEEIVEDLRVQASWVSPTPLPNRVPPKKVIPREFKAILQHFKDETVQLSSLLTAVHIEMPELHRTLLEMELQGYIKQLPGQWYKRIDV